MPDSLPQCLSVRLLEGQAADQRQDRRGRRFGRLGSGLGLCLCLGSGLCVCLAIGAGRCPGPRRHVPPQPAADAGQVGARSLPGQDPGDPLRDGCLEQRDTLGRDGGHRDDLVARPQDPPERLAAPHQRLRQQRPTVEMQHVECQERRGAPRRPAEPPRQLLGIGPSSGVDDDELPVEDRRPRRDPDRQAGQLGQQCRQVASFSVEDPDLATAGDVGGPDHDQRPLAAPPRLEQVLVRIECGGQRARKHRPQVREIGQLVGLEAQRELVGHRRPMVDR